MRPVNNVIRFLDPIFCVFESSDKNPVSNKYPEEIGAKKLTQTG